MSAMMQTNELELCIGSRVLLSRLDWQLEAGQCWCVIGRNGAGKSTLIRTLAGLRQPERGAVAIGGRPLPEWPLEQLARQRAYLPQGRSDTFSYSVLETVLTARHPYHDSRYWESDADYMVAYQALQAMDVSHLAQRDLRTLSGGERQRVAIAAVVAQDTPILLLDEPVSALDLGHQMSVMNLLTRLCRLSGKTVVLVSHDLNWAHAVATHALLLMDDGGWHAGPMDEVMRAPLLSRCLGHPIEAVQHGGRTIFIPVEEAI
jgi:iron complex transport system ATP-binding protein